MLVMTSDPEAIGGRAMYTKLFALSFSNNWSMLSATCSL